MSLQKLPNELLLVIMDIIDPYDWESFVLVCKQFLDLGRPRMLAHNLLRSRYRHFRFDQHWFGISSTRQLLDSIAGNPRIADYIVEMDFGRNASRIPLKNTPQLLKLLQNSSILSMAEQDPQRWHDGILADRSDWPLVFLLTLLPNLQVLQVRQYWYLHDNLAAPEILAVMRVLVQQANSVTNASPSSLGRLQTLRANNDEAFEGITPFLGINYLKEIYADVQGLSLTNLRPHSWLRDAGKNLHTIELSRVELDVRRCESFFGGTPNLKILKLELALDEETGPDEQIDPIIRCLADNVGHSLEALSLSMAEGYNNAVIILEEDFKEFACLIYLEIDSRLFWYHQDAIDEELHDPYVLSTTSVAKLIPYSLEALDIFTSATEEDYAWIRTFFRNFESTIQHYHTLQQVTVTCSYVCEDGQALYGPAPIQSKAFRNALETGFVFLKDVHEPPKAKFVKAWSARFPENY